MNFCFIIINNVLLYMLSFSSKVVLRGSGIHRDILVYLFDKKVGNTNKFRQFYAFVFG